MRVPANYDLNVFINCPFDQKYLELLRAVIFAVRDCGSIARCVQEINDASQVRVAKIFDIIPERRIGIHDISHTEVDTLTHGATSSPALSVIAKEDSTGG